MNNPVVNETCKDYYSEDNVYSCQEVLIPNCADRTINCTEPTSPAGAVVSIVNSPDPENLRSAGTEINFACTKPAHSFDYPIGPDFVSYYYEKSFNDITISCTNDR